MLYRKSGYPVEGEIVVSKVTEVHYNSVFVNLEEYGHKAMLHISEVSPGRIRNIRDYVKEGKVIICVVLRVRQDRGLIDVSLRRVNEGQRRKKVSQIKQEQMAEKIVEFAAKDLKIEMNKLYDEVTEKVFEKYATLYDCFEDMIVNETQLASLGIRPEVDKVITGLVKQRIKPQKIMISGKINMFVYESDGVEVIKEIVAKTLKLKEEGVTIKYLGAGNYKLDVVADDYKQGEKMIEEVTSFIQKEMKTHNGSYGFERVDSD